MARCAPRDVAAATDAGDREHSPVRLGAWDAMCPPSQCCCCALHEGVRAWTHIFIVLGLAAMAGRLAFAIYAGDYCTDDTLEQRYYDDESRLPFFQVSARARVCGSLSRLASSFSRARDDERGARAEFSRARALARGPRAALTRRGPRRGRGASGHAPRVGHVNPASTPSAAPGESSARARARDRRCKSWVNKHGLATGFGAAVAPAHLPAGALDFIRTT